MNDERGIGILPMSGIGILPMTPQSTGRHIDHPPSFQYDKYEYNAVIKTTELFSWMIFQKAEGGVGRR